MDLSEVTTNLVPYPRLHFLAPALAPLAALQGAGHHAAARGLDQVRGLAGAWGWRSSGGVPGAAPLETALLS